jgi:hypothetical protein
LVRRKVMLLFYLIDPVGRSVKKVSDGFDKASALLGADFHALKLVVEVRDEVGRISVRGFYWVTPLPGVLEWLLQWNTLARSL